LLGLGGRKDEQHKGFLGEGIAMTLSIDADLTVLQGLLASGDWIGLTGAGVSTDSGVPGYRDETGVWLGASPMQFSEFAGSEAARRRYWARSLVGFERMNAAVPNLAHYALAALEAMGHLSLLVTQNVDGLHQRAGSKRVLELHGRLAQVVCLTCDVYTERNVFQTELRRLNPDWQAKSGVSRPDGDAEIEEAALDAFRVPMCANCGGLLKPDVVFFGERVPVSRHRLVQEQMNEARGLLVVGSSLMVNSGYRIVRAAEQAKLPIVVINRGRTRADAVARLKCEGNAGTLLSQLVTRLSPAGLNV
jgi:NAD-dependent SIR2 family protein deacetylase